MMNAQLCLCTALLFVALCAQAADDRIQPYAKNPRYWQFKGKPVLLLGGTDDDNLFQWTGKRLTDQLDTLVSVGGNYVRCTMSCRDEGDVWPFAKKGTQYDLNKWNPEFWRRFETFLAETAKRDIIVQIEVWATFDYYRDNWDVNPFNPKNNVNYTAKEAGLPTQVKTHPVRCENPFFFSPPKARKLPTVLTYQRRFVEKLLSYSLAHGHVLYCMDNETSVTPEWGFYWAAFIRETAKAGGRQVETTEMWDKWDLAHPQHNPTFERHDLYTFCDISQNNHQKGQAHYDNAQKQRKRIAGHIRPLNNVKIYGADTGRFGTTRDGIERFWRNVFGGLASARFHRPDSGQGLNKAAQRNLASAREVTDTIDIFACEPHSDLLGDRKPNEAYCIAEPGRQYAVYFPAAGDVTLSVKGAPTTLAIRWYGIDKGKWLEPTDASGGGIRILRLKTPGKGQWAAVVR